MISEQRTADVEQTEALGRRLGAHLAAGDVIWLCGEMGAGKTSLARGLALGWGSLDQPNSPTFALVNQYRRAADAQHFYHIDCYRLAGPQEAQTIALEDILSGPDVTVLEWPERIAAALPPDRLQIHISAGEAGRTLRLEAFGPRAAALLAAADLS